MKIGILQTAYKKASEYGAYYNVQELGLSRALANLGHEVILYKAVDGDSTESAECEGRLTIKLICTKYIGINGLIDISVLNNKLDALIYFCDTQIKVSSVYRWCVGNNIKFIPYVGVLESHSENTFKRFIMRAVAKRNLAIYKKCATLAKTPMMKKELENCGCRDVILFPAGLDETVMAKGMDRGDASRSHKCVERILYVGRMEEEKHPLEMLDLYENMLSYNSDVCLMMIGDGYLYDTVRTEIEEIKHKKNIKPEQLVLIKKVPYSDMYQYYMYADVFINLNKVEILGMSILEAMYYKCPVIAIDAPGPRFILENSTNKYGFIVENTSEIVTILTAADKQEFYKIKEKAYERVKKEFVWDSLIIELDSMLNSKE